MKEEKTEKLYKSLINKMMEKYNITFDDIKNNINEDKRWIIDGEDWYTHYTMTEQEYEEFRDWGINEIKKTYHITKKAAASEFGWFWLSIGLRIDNGNNTREVE